MTHLKKIPYGVGGKSDRLQLVVILAMKVCLVTVDVVTGWPLAGVNRW